MSYYSEYSEEIYRDPTQILELLSVKVTCSFTSVTTPLLQRRTESRLKQMMIANQYGNTFESFQNVCSNQNTFYRRPLGDADSSERVKENSFMGTLNNSSVHLMIYTLWFDQFSLQTKGSKNKNNHSIL